MANIWEYNGNSDRLNFLELQNQWGRWLEAMKLKMPAAWKKNYDKPRQHIKKQRHYFANKDLYSQSYGFSSSVQLLMSDSLWPHESQHTRPPCPSPTPGVYSNSCPSSQWYHPAISSSVIPFSYCPQSLQASGSFPMSHLFAWGGQSIEVSASVSVLPMNTQDWSPLGWTGWISLQSKRLSESSPTPQFKSINSSPLSFLYSPTLTAIHDHWKNHRLDETDLYWQSNVGRRY